MMYEQPKFIHHYFFMEMRKIEELYIFPILYNFSSYRDVFSIFLDLTIK